MKAERDADYSSTSAAASTRGSSVSETVGRRTAVATQPWCLSVPRKGGWPAILPVSRMRCASKPGGHLDRRALGVC